MNLRAEAEATLDAFHAAAAAADAEAYAATISDAIVFLGTAPGERWEGAAWRSFFRSYFAQGKGWTYVPRERSVVVGADGATAWFDETVENQHYGACRGTGVMRREGGVWRIEQYNLTIPVPDALVPDLTGRIRELDTT